MHIRAGWLCGVDTYGEGGGRGPLCCLFYVGGRWFCWLFGAVSFVSDGGELTRPPVHQVFQGHIRNKRGIAGSVLMMGAVVRGWGRVRDRFSRQFFCFSRDTAMASAFDLDEQFVFVLFLLLVSR